MPKWVGERDSMEGSRKQKDETQRIIDSMVCIRIVWRHGKVTTPIT
jgi:hypothetical protein